MTTDAKMTTPLAAELMRLRQKYIAEGGKLFTLDEIEAELGRSLATAPTNAAPQEGQSGNWPLGQSGTPTNAAPDQPSDTPSDELVDQLSLIAWAVPIAGKVAGRIEADRQRIVELEKMLATESEVTLKFSEAIDRLERELAEAEKFRDYFERESVIWRKRAEKAGRERDEALISALGMEYDENGWQDLARAALDMYGRKP